MNSDNGASIANNIVKTIVSNGMEVIEGLHWDTQIPKPAEMKDSLLEKYVGACQTNRDFR